MKFVARPLLTSILATVAIIAGQSASAQSLERSAIDPLALPPAEEAAADASASARAVVPREFHGRWVANHARCADPDAPAITIAAETLRFYGSAGQPAAIKALGPRAIELAGRFSDAGGSWEQTHRLSLSADGRQLTVVTRGVTAHRYRCE